MLTATAAPPLGDAPAKGHKDENFPVASVLIRADLRPAVLAFYRFARAADDIADDPAADPASKLRRLAAMRAGLDGNAGSAEALALHATLARRGVTADHAHDLLDAFEQDVRVDRYADWDALIGYCRLSAMPVGRFMLDIHGEDRACWAASDALCAALQIINHLQDCGKDYRALARVYIPADSLAAAGAAIGDLAADRATPGLRRAIAALAARTRGLLDDAAGFAAAIRDRRLAAEVAVIHALAVDLAGRLEHRDPLAERVHHRKAEAAVIAIRAALPVLLRRQR